MGLLSRRLRLAKKAGTTFLICSTYSEISDFTSASEPTEMIYAPNVKAMMEALQEYGSMHDGTILYEVEVKRALKVKFKPEVEVVK